MILPTKHTPESKTLLGFGAKVLLKLDSPKTFNDLWSVLKDSDSTMNYGHFILALDFLFIVGAIEYKRGRILRCDNA
jgi:hypothetical protein